MTINYNDDDVMSASVWFVLFGGQLQCQNPWYMGGKCDNKEGDLNWEYEIGSDINKGNIMEVTVHFRVLCWMNDWHVCMHFSSLPISPTNGENWPLVTNEPIEKYLVQDLNFMKITHQCRGIYGTYLTSIKKNRKMSTCNRVDLETLGS